MSDYYEDEYYDDDADPEGYWEEWGWDESEDEDEPHDPEQFSSFPCSDCPDGYVKF